jgi:hypothetical protein
MSIQKILETVQSLVGQIISQKIHVHKSVTFMHYAKIVIVLQTNTLFGLSYLRSWHMRKCNGTHFNNVSNMLFI